MEKKGSRLVQPAFKGLTSDSKKSQDGVSGKLWSRSGRRRESATGSIAAKSESSRKPIPSRTTKTFDSKRPRPRGTFNTSSMGRTETTRLEEEYEAELGSVFMPGSKKQSLNHLLNFVYGTPAGEGRYQCERGFTSKTSSRFILTRKHKYNKEHFLQANCQFVVNSSGDYKQYLNNPDALVDWSFIEQVNVQASENPSCPICLYPPVAAKMTRCGHIYCWSCVLHYLSLSDKTCRKCPICYESVYKQELKSVVTKQFKTYNVNDVITFKLMKRAKNSLITYPASALVRDEEIFTFSEIKAADVYSKLLLASQTEILSIIERENNELRAQLLKNGECLENCFIEEALKLLAERKDAVLTSLDLHIPTVKGHNKENVHGILGNVEITDGKTKPTTANLKLDNLDISSNLSRQAKFHYFYQASDGQHIYLHAINARMLEHSFGSLEQSPKTLSGRILEKEGGSMTEELRKRLRYLQHLPVTCQFEVAEIQLKQPVVTKETLEHFQEQTEIRRKRRQRRAREEKKREKQIATEENRLMGKYPVPNLQIESEFQFPHFEGKPRTESECTELSECTSLEIPSLPSSLPTGSEHARPSFAKMLTSAKKAEINGWPSLKMPLTPVKFINVTGQKTSSSNFVVHNKNDSEPDLENFTSVPSSRCLGEAIVEAIQRAEKNDAAPDCLPLRKKKKKKSRQKVLFTTTIAYPGK